MDKDELSITDRSRVRRYPSRAHHDRATVESILDEALVAHVGFVHERAPMVIPCAFVRVDGHVYLHGAVANRLLGAAASGVEICLEVTVLDGLVLAKSAFHHSLNYRSVVLFGQAREVEDADRKRAVLAALVERVARGRSGEVRPPSERELGATRVLALPIEEGSAKIRTGPPLDDERDRDRPCWAGVVPVTLVQGSPVRESSYRGYVLSDERRRIDFGIVAGWMTAAYWSPGITRAEVEHAAAFSSLLVGAHAPDGEQVGYLRVVSDRQRFAYLMDVFVAEAHRRLGIARALVRFALDHPDHRAIKRWMLGTRDAHAVYAAEGFGPVPDPTALMVRARS